VLPLLEAGIGGGAGVPGEVPIGREPLRAGGVADEDRGGHRPAAGLGEQLRGVGVDQAGELGEQFAFLAADLGDPLEQLFGDSQPRGLGLAGELAGQSRTDPGAFQCRLPRAGLRGRGRS
jgi:hypothetical protein